MPVSHHHTRRERGTTSTASGRRRILYLTHSAAFDGSSLCLLSLLRQLDRTRFEPMVALPTDGALRRSLNDGGIATVVVPTLRPLFWITAPPGPRDVVQFVRALPGVAAVERLCRALEPDVVHINSSVIFHLAIGARAIGARVVLHAREHWELPRRDPRDLLKRWVVERHVDRVVGVSREAIRCFDAADKSVLRYEWADPQHGPDGHDGDDVVLPWPADAALLLDMGGRHPHKGALDSVRAMGRLRARGHLAVLGGARVGSAPWQEALRSALDRTPLRSYGMQLDAQAAAASQRVSLVPALRNVAAAIERSIAVLCPFRTPHFAMPALEAGALGRPVIACDWPEAREVIVDGETGILVAPGDVAALARAMDALLNDPTRVAAMGTAGRERVARCFDATTATDIIHAVYDELS